MKLKKTIYLLPLLGLSSASAASTFTDPGVTSHYNIGTNFEVSVNSSNAGFYSATGNNGSVDVTIADTIVDYNFIQVTSNTDTTPETYASSGSNLISGISMTARNGLNYNTQGWMDLWTTSNPGSDLSLPSVPADYTANTIVREGATASGSINISTLSSGSIYFIYGGFRSGPTFNATMKDTNGSELDMDLLGFGDEDFSNGDENYVKRIDFTNGDGYDTIDWSGTSSLYNGDPHFSFDGLILTGVVAAIPEPSSMALLGLGGLALLRRRR